MSDGKIKQFGIIGAGQGGWELFNTIHGSGISNVAYVCDVNTDTELMKKAANSKIKVFSDLMEAMNYEVDFVLDTTGNIKVESMLRDKYPIGSKTKIIDGWTAMFLLELVNTLEDDEDTLTNRFMSFEVANELYAIELSKVREIVQTPNITPLPSSTNYNPGIIKLRDEIIPIIDLSILMELGKQTDKKTSCTVIVERNGKNLGLLVDSTREVLIIPPENISLPPQSNKKAHDSRFVKKVGLHNETILLILDEEGLFNVHTSTENKADQQDKAAETQKEV